MAKKKKTEDVFLIVRVTRAHKRMLGAVAKKRGYKTRAAYVRAKLGLE
jgi:hypothetical protein